MNNKNFSIGVLSVTGLILLVSQFLPLQTARADFTIKDRSYTLCTTNSSLGGDVVYIIKNNTGQVAVFSWDVGRRVLVLKAVGPLADTFR